MTGTRLYQSVAEQITRLIDDGAFPPGTRLPGERDMAERLNVSRVTIREAEIALQAIGRLEIKTGSGVYVSEKKPETLGVLPRASAFEVTEARLLIESEAAALAAHNITDEGIATLEKLVEEMGSPDDAISNEADQKFHLTIAKASNNVAILHTIQTLWRMREDLPDVSATYKSVCAHDADTRTAEHRYVFDALKNRDAVAARAAMRQHFHRLLQAMLDATEQQALEELRRRVSESRERFTTTQKIG